MVLLSRPRPDPVLPGQESVWAFPRPARAEPTLLHLREEFGGKVLADTRRGFRVIETSLPPSYYFPPADVDASCLRAVQAGSLCEWKGAASYFDVVAGGRTAQAAAWTYRDPTEDFLPMKDFIAFYCRPMDACWVGEEQARPQEGRFYGGWITSHVAGPFKGPAGTQYW